jgi:Protein of unknown function (DUF1501)
MRSALPALFLFACAFAAPAPGVMANPDSAISFCRDVAPILNRQCAINAKAGRDHWPSCYSVLLAGGGVKRGYIHGASDKFAMYPARDPVKLDDLAATIYYLLGIDPRTEVHDTQNRPLPIAKGNPVMDIIA